MWGREGGFDDLKFLSPFISPWCDSDAVDKDGQRSLSASESLVHLVARGACQDLQSLSNSWVDYVVAIVEDAVSFIAHV